MKKILFYSLTMTLLLFCSCDRDDDTDIKSSKVTNEDAETIVHDGETREYILYVPDSYDALSSFPLIFNFHGFGGTASEYMTDADMRSLADSENFILVYPQGSLLDGSPHWNAALDSPDNKSDADDLGFINALIDELSSDYLIDQERIYACGYSNGGFFSYALACYLSDKIAAIGAVSGTMLDTSSTCTPGHPTAIISIHGTSDDVIPYEGDSYYFSNETVVNYWTNFNNTTTTPVLTTFDDNGTTIEHYQYSGGDSEVSVAHYKVISGGHVWFSLNYQGADTGQLIWNFLSQYDINGLR